LAFKTINAFVCKMGAAARKHRLWWLDASVCPAFPTCRETSYHPHLRMLVNAGKHLPVGLSALRCRLSRTTQKIFNAAVHQL
jgi:hypothetical protein